MYFVKAVFTSLVKVFNQNFLSKTSKSDLAVIGLFRYLKVLMGVFYLQSTNTQTKQVMGLYLFPSDVITNLDCLM